MEGGSRGWEKDSHTRSVPQQGGGPIASTPAFALGLTKYPRLLYSPVAKTQREIPVKQGFFLNILQL